MIQAHIGELAALITAVSWTLTAIAFEASGKKVGSLSVNYIRLFIAFVLLAIYTFFSRGIALPIDASATTWFWLLISGLIGFVIGDFFLFKAYVEIGSRISLLIMSTAPPITALAGFLLMGERISMMSLVGMFITMCGICLVVLSRNTGEKKFKLNRPIKGLVFAGIGALGQAFGLIFSKFGMGNYNPFAATQIRLISAIIGFTIIITFQKKWPELKEAFKNREAIGQISIGAFFGPFVGVSFSLMAVQYTATGIVSTITSLSPILIIPASIIIFKEKVRPKEIVGALISISGVILLFV